MKVEENLILKNLGIESLNKMQHESQRAILSKGDTLLLSPTGSGKTIAFLLPILQLLDKDINAVQCLIIVPSRELGLQIERVWRKMGTSFKVNFCYGGHSINTELDNLSNPPAILIGTPGRLVDHIERKSFSQDNIKTLVLDEFDKSLQLGFHEEMTFIIEKTRAINKRILVSATGNIDIPHFVGINNLNELDFIPKEYANEKLSTKLVYSKDKDKVNTLFHLICSFNSEPAIVFCNHREASERICEMLNQKGIYTIYYHGGMEQDERERVLIKFMNGSARYLIATDLASRGLDIPEMNHVVHYHLPSREEDFIHRNGRTARMKATGTAYILLHEDEKPYDYIDYTQKTHKVDSISKLPNEPDFKTLYISGGKKNKINKTDIVGFFTQVGKLPKDAIGKIEVKDFTSFVAVKSTDLKKLFKLIKDEKMKGKKYKIEEAREVIQREV